MNIITGYTGEPHITSVQDRDGNQGSYGTGSYILNVGSKMAATIVSANEVRIADGVLSHQGCLGSIDRGSYESCEISNGSQGMKRSDLIVCRYEKDSETNVESLFIVVIKGTPAASNPAVPTYNTGNIQSGDSPVDMPLYQVNIDGVSISSVTTRASFVRTQAELDANPEGRGSLATGTNMNSLLTPGCYLLSGSNSYSNLPTGVTYGVVEVVKSVPSSDQFVLQVVHGNGDSLYTRMYINNAWTSWKQYLSAPYTRVETVTATYTRAASGASGATFTLPSISGYTPVGIVGFYSGTNHGFPYDVRMTSSSAASMMVQSDGTAAASATASINVLYVRTS